MKILFMGTPDFAVPSLQALIEAGHEIVGVFTQPDKPKNRGMKLLPTPVKVVALEHDIPVFQPTKLRDGTALETIQSLAPELIVVAAYGRILPQEILDYPKLGCINVHSSLLPKYRGSAPIHWAILNGDAESGVTIMNVVLELDAGDIISQAVTPIDPDETVETLHDRLADMGAKLLVDTVVSIENGTATRTPQQAELVTHAPMLSRPLTGFSYGELLLTTDAPTLDFSFTVTGDTAVQYRLIDYENGKWNWEAAKTFLDGSEDGTQLLTPGRKTRTLTLTLGSAFCK